MIDEAYVEIKSKIDPGFGSDVQRAVQRAIKPVAAEVDRALAPVKESIKDSVEEPFQSVADAVNDSMRSVSNDIKKSVSAARRDFNSFNTQIEKVEANLKQLRTEAGRRIALDINADTSDIDEQVRDLEGSLRRLKAARASVKIDVDVEDAELARVKAELADLGGPGGKGPLDRLRESFDGLGDGIKGFVTGALKGAGLFTALATTAAGLGPILVGATAAVVALGGALGLAAGSAISLAGVGASLGLAFAAVKIASIGVGDAVKAQSKAQQELAKTGEVSEATQQALEASMKNLAPAARGVVKALAEVQSQFGGVRKALQQSLFEGQGKNLKAVAGTILPALKTSLLGITDALNGAGDQFTKFVTKGKGGEQIRAILTGLSDTFRRLLPAIGNIGAALLNLFQGATGPSGQLADSIVGITERFQQFTERITASGQFTQFLNDASEAAGKLFGFLGNLGRVLVGVFGAGAAQGVGLLGSMSEALGDLADKINSVAGQKALSDFFSTIGVAGSILKSTFEALAPAIGGILSAVAPTLQTLSSVVGQVAAVFITALQPAIDALTPTFGALRSTLEDIREPVSVLAQVLGSILASALQNLFALVGPLLAVLKPLVGALASIAGALPPAVLEGIAAALTAVTVAFGVYLAAVKIAAVVSKAFAVVQTAVGAALSLNPIGLVVIAIAALVAALVIAYKRSETFRNIVNTVGNALKTAFLVSIKAVGKAISATVGFIGKIVGSLSRFKSLLLLLLGPIGAVILAFKNWDKIKAILAKVGQFIADFVKKAVQWFTSLPAKLGSALANLGSIIGNAFVSALAATGEFIVTGLINVVQAFVALPERIASAVGDLASALVAKFVQLFVALGNAEIAGITALVNFFKELPKRIVSALGSLASSIGNVFRNMFNALKNIVTTAIQNNIQFWSALPGRIVAALRSMASAVGNVFNSVFNAARGIVTRGISTVVGLIGGLPGKITALGSKMLNAGKTLISKIFEGIKAAAKGVGGLASDIASAIKSAINSALGLPFTIHGPGPLPDFTIPAFAKGGIFNRPTVGLFGEAGKEAIIPVTDRAPRGGGL